MKNNKGLTLVELLGVLVVLGLIVVIVTPTITKNLKMSQVDLCYHQLDSLVSASKNWLTDQINNNYDQIYAANGQFILQEVTGEELLNGGYVSSLDDKYTSVEIQITKVGQTFQYNVLNSSNYCE